METQGEHSQRKRRLYKQDTETKREISTHTERDMLSE
jgi:hypothetical protein